MSAVHVFRCEELATEIFNHITPGPLRKTDTIQYRLCRHQRQATLARAARVCRAWSGPALNVLWRVVDDVHNLLSLLPAYSIDGLYTVFARDILPAEWERFQMYASRVRELHWQQPPTDPIDSEKKPIQYRHKYVSASVWSILSRWCPRQGVCPRLQYLAPLLISPSDPGPLIFVSPTVRHLEIAVRLSNGDRMDDYIVAGLFSQMRPMLTSLESLTIRSSSDLDLLGTLLVSPVDVHLLDLADLRTLRSLDLCFVTVVLSQPLINAVESMNLDELALTIELLDENVSISAESRSPLRNSLHKLHLIGSPRPVAQFVEYAAGPSMEALSVKFPDVSRDTSSVLYEAFERIAGQLSQHVTEISLTLSGDLELHHAILPAHNFLKHLVPKSHLLHVALIYQDVYGWFSRRALIDMVDAWPNLSVLRIDNPRGSPQLAGLSDDDQAPDLGSLARFVQRHPQLRHFVIPALRLHTLPETRQIPQLDHPLEILRIDLFHRFMAPEHSVFAVALLLDRLFPNLDLCRPQFQAVKASAGEEQEWDQVERFLLALQAGRRGTHRD